MYVARGEPGAAVRIFAATALVPAAPLMIHIPMIDEHIIATARRMLGVGEFTVAWAERQSMTLEHVVTRVVGAAPDSVTSAPDDLLPRILATADLSALSGAGSLP